MKSANQRVRDVIHILKQGKYIRNQQDFTERIGADKSTVSQVVNDKISVPNNLFGKISKAFPQFSTVWLLTGEGEMLKGAEPQRETEDERRSERVSVPYTVPLIPISAQGGSFNDFVVSVRDGDCEKVISPVRHIDFALTVTGDSMAPEYPSGSQVLVRKVDGRAFIEWGRVYVLDTCNGTVIKKLNPGRDDDEVQCVSVNPDYQPFYVKLSDVYGLYRVMMCMTLK